MKFWLPLAAAITLLCGLVYGTVQQSYRTGANDPQIQMAEDAAHRLSAGEPAETLLPSGKVEISQSQAPYWIVFDSNGKPLAGNALLHGDVPSLPGGVFDYTRQHGEDRITWQPEPGVRSATVIAAVDGGNGGFVLAGRSLREAEARVDQLTTLVGAAWLVSLFATFVLVAFFELLPFTRSRYNQA